MIRNRLSIIIRSLAITIIFTCQTACHEQELSPEPTETENIIPNTPEKQELPVKEKTEYIILADNPVRICTFDTQRINIVIKHTSDFVATANVPWIKQPNTKSTLKWEEQTFLLETNESNKARTGRIQFHCTDCPDSSFLVTIIQKGYDPVLSVSQPGFYGINGEQKHYIYETAGWNQTSFKKDIDGNITYRLTNTGNISSVTIKGIHEDMKPGDTTMIEMKSFLDGVPQRNVSYQATLLHEQDGLHWIKVNSWTFFVLQY